MIFEDPDPIRQIAEQVADCLAESGYAFVEDDKIDDLARQLSSFLTASGIPIDPYGTGKISNRLSAD